MELNDVKARLELLLVCQGNLDKLQEIIDEANSPKTTPPRWGVEGSYDAEKFRLSLVASPYNKIRYAHPRALKQAINEAMPALLARTVELQQAEITRLQQELSDPLLDLAVEFRP